MIAHLILRLDAAEARRGAAGSPRICECSPFGEQPKAGAHCLCANRRQLLTEFGSRQLFFSKFRQRQSGLQGNKVSACRGNPFRRVVEQRDGSKLEVDCSDDLIQRFRNNKIDALIAVGGDGSLSIAYELHKKGLCVVGVPKTIDNDLESTAITFGPHCGSSSSA